MEVLSEAVRKAGKDHVDVRPLTKGLGRGGARLSEKQVKRYLDGDPPPGGKIDGWAQVVADAVGTGDPYPYWEEALRRAGRAASGETR
jgi:hypothetical protein